MIGLARSVSDRRQNIFTKEERVILQDFFVRCASAEKLEDIGDAHALPADRWTAAAFTGFHRDPLQ